MERTDSSLEEQGSVGDSSAHSAEGSPERTKNKRVKLLGRSKKQKEQLPRKSRKRPKNVDSDSISGTGPAVKHLKLEERSIVGQRSPFKVEVNKNPSFLCCHYLPTTTCFLTCLWEVV